MTHFRVYEDDIPFVHVTLHRIIRKSITIGSSHDIFKRRYYDIHF